MWSRLKEGLAKTSQRFTHSLSALFQSSTLTAAQWEEMEDNLIMADLGVSVTEKILAHIRGLGPMSQEDLRQKLVDYMTSLLAPYEKRLLPPRVLLAVGVNGSGKTTTLGKLGWRWHQEGRIVRLVAADTFRAAAVDQLALWGKGLHVTSGGKDPASVVFQGLQQAGPDEVVLIDTAGRLPNKPNLMEELTKVYAIIKRFEAVDSLEVVLVLDASLGQHTLVQVEAFQKILPLTGLILNKMDGTAKGGSLMSLVETYQLPIYGLGVGEKPEDFCDFQARAFAEGILGA